MKTNKEEIMISALQLFMYMNYEKVSLQMIAKNVGLTKTGIFNYFPTKLDLFIAVIDKYVLRAQDPKEKYGTYDGTFCDFIEKYIAGIKYTMEVILNVGNIKKESMPGKSASAGYFHLFNQAILYYPDGKNKIISVIEKDCNLWRKVIEKSIEIGEIKKNTNIEMAVALLHNLFIGMSYEMSFFDGLNADLLKERLTYIYELLKS